MRKYMRCSAASLLMAALLLQSACGGTNNNNNVEIQSTGRGMGGERLEISSEGARIPLINNEYVPIRDLTEAAGYRSDWNPASQILSVGDTDVIFQIAMNVPHAEIDGEPLRLSGSPVLINGRPHLPVSVIPELFRRELRYSVENNHVVVHAAANNMATAERPSAGIQPFASQNAKVAVVKRSVTMRRKPSVQGEKIRYAKAGERLSILETVNRYWLKVKDANGRIGYVSSSTKYVSITGGSAAAPTPSTPPATRTPEAPAANASIRNVIDAGMKYLGTPYEFGSSRSNTRTFDCSDFVRQAYIDGAGITLPSNSRTQGDYVRRIGKTTSDWRQLRPGDIMFFMSYKGSRASNYNGINKSTQRITHDGIYIGNGKVLHTYSETAGGVRVDSFEGRHWEYRFLFGGSVF